MAKSSSYGLAFACFAIAAAVAGGTQFTVGGANGWSVPTAGAEPFNTWAERTRFQIGDSLVFVYPKDQDSVLLVEPADYNACNTSSYVKKFDDGDTVVTLDRSGPLFFISGVEANCRANEKLIVMVLAARSNGTGGGAQAPSTAPPPASPASPPPASSTPPPPSSPAPKGAPTTGSPPAPPANSAPPPASAPTKTPRTPPAASSSPPAPSASSPPPASSTPPPPPAPAGAPQAPPAPSASSPAPSAHGSTTNSTGTASSPPAGSKDKNGAALTVATGLASSFGACILGYTMLAL
ncbi:early nodulin-like protein 18 [Miscanthus floridulus]|uniref:early nodulin-like protein 18 n=1 Tax=Miscanthus floridulus TaxID=154761 RepID=UPI0034579EA3